MKRKIHLAASITDQPYKETACGKHFMGNGVPYEDYIATFKAQVGGYLLVTHTFNLVDCNHCLRCVRKTTLDY